MPDYNAGEAKVRIRPDARDFVRELEAKLRATKDPGYTVKVEAELGPARREVGEWRKEEARNDVGVDVDADTKGATTHMVEWREGQERRPIEIKVVVDTAGASRQLAGLQKSIGGSGGLGSALKLNLGALAIGNLPAAATALTTVAGALQQVSQAGLVIPGVFAGLGTSFGTAALGFSGMKDALEAVNKAADGTPESMQKAQDALKALAPNAQDVVTTIAALKPEFDGLRNVVSQNMFAGVAGQLRTLTTAELPALTKGLGDIGTAWNHNITALITSLGSSRNTGLLDRILGNTADAQDRVSKAIDPLVRGIGTLAAAGTDALPRLADALGSVAGRFANFIEEADKDGSLDKWINDGLTGMTHLGDAALNIGKSFTAITQAAGGGGSFLTWLDTATGKLQTFLNSTEGQQKLKEFFDEGREQLAQWLPILENLVGIFGSVYEASKQWTDALLPPLEKITGFLANNGDLVKDFALGFTAWKTIDGITSLLGNLGLVKTSLSKELPEAATTGALGVNKALALIVVPEIGKQLNDQIQQWLKDNHPDAYDANNSNTPDQLGQKARQAFDQHVFPTPNTTATSLPPSAPNSANTPTVGGIPIPGLQLPGRADGGAINGPGSARSDSIPAWLSNGEHVFTAADVAAMGGQAGVYAFRAALHRADGGAVIDQYGNPVTPGGSPGPVAPNPMGGGGGSILDNIISSLSAPIGNALNLGSGLLGAGLGNGVDPNTTVHGTANGAAPGPPPGSPATLPLADRAAQVPGLIGLFGSAMSSNPEAALQNWGTQTAKWTADWGVKTIGGVASTLWNGALGMFGLENSILSANNPWTQAGLHTAQFALGNDGPIGTILGKNSATLPDGTTVQIPDSPTTARQSGQTVDGAPAANYAGGSAKVHNAVYSAFKAAGYDDSEWPSLVNLINGESGWRTSAKNPSSSAYGLFQFLDSTWETVGAKRTSDPSQQAAAGMAYIAQRYGSPSKAWAFWQAQSPHWYETGGPTPPGRSKAYPAILHGDEYVVSARGRASVPDSFLHALNTGAVNAADLPAYYYGGPATQGVVPLPPPKPNFTPGPGVKHINPTTPSPAAPVAPRQAPSLPQPVAPAPPTTPPPVESQPAAQNQGAAAQSPGLAQVARAPSSLDHNIGWLDTAITSGASAIGQAISTAVGIAAAGAGGAGSLGGAAGLGALGSYAGGLAVQGGKIVSDAANVVSSFLVGSVPGSMGDPNGPVGGTTLRPAQNRPATAEFAISGGNTYNISGHNTDDVLRTAQNQEALQRQGILATVRG